MDQGQEQDHVRPRTGRHEDLDDASSSEIRDRIDETRSRIDRTMDEFVHHLKPRTLAHELAQIADFDSEFGARLRQRAANVGRRFVDEVEHNPVPLFLIGTGLAWMAVRGGRGRTGDGRETDGGTAGAKLGRARAAAARGVANVKGAVSRGRETAAGAVASAKEKMSSAAGRVSAAAGSARHNVERAWHNAPLAVGAGAAALGIVCGFLLPRTRVEDRALGEAAERARERAREAGRTAGSKAADAAASAAEEALGSRDRPPA